MVKDTKSSLKRVPKWLEMNDPTKLTNSFEFGPAWWIHLPMKIFGFYWGLRLWNPGFFAAANPGLENGGLYDYSKHHAVRLFEDINLPKSVLVRFPYSLPEISSLLEVAKISYPIVAKPDFGERGREVEFLENEENLIHYFSTKVNGDYILQENLNEGLEFGVFYSKNPNTCQSKITSLTLKIPLQVIGDGENPLHLLIQNHPRASRYPKEINNDNISYIPKKGELVKLSQKGNHCKGAVFLDCSEYIDEELVNVFEKICSPFVGFFYGRLDIKVKEWKDLWEVPKVKILEVNGCNSEPIHIYSPDNTYLDAIQSVSDHFSIMASISKFNLKNKNYQPNLTQLWSNFLNFRKSRNL